MSQQTPLKERFSNAVEMTKDRINQAADKVRSGIHEVKAETAPSFIEKTSESVKAKVDDLKSKVSEAKANERMKKMMQPVGKMASGRNMLLLTALGLGAFFLVRRRKMMA
ncbi:hypothetical protein [Deinococcus cellulosilyticus]|uniref:DUF3618 domain-containing protein n=1 Tax=Deinococcus cellulosilyticus (strain DSM 18568 / NBRC 106333 / KACC 11606 / 5516J-15) TaxID=1223518 RepID=A0A511N6J9_DEIC1|nr:hypothetical protein [Deinococcus cellulosilyticus]GEM48087.1 hypothetical protein DC3_37220 [Deinococcus cellulosilyticus NBRC 106333 = KACC 11606]